MIFINWYILYCLNAKTEKICSDLNDRGIFTFIPKMEVYLRTQGLIQRVMFPNYIFIKTDKQQEDFSDYIKGIKANGEGIIRELKYLDDRSFEHDYISPLTSQEIQLFNKLFDQEGIVRLSKVKFVNDKPLIFEGPLINFNYHIKKLDIHDGLAYLDITLEGNPIIAGIKLEKN